MMSAVHFPSDEFTGNGPHDFDLAADYLELKAAMSDERQAFSQDIVDALELAAEAEFADVDAEIKSREEVANRAVARMTLRKRALAAAYPFDLDDRGDTIVFTADQPDLGQAAYLISLLLSHHRSLSPLLNSDLHITSLPRFSTPSSIARCRRCSTLTCTLRTRRSANFGSASNISPRPLSQQRYKDLHGPLGIPDPTAPGSSES